MTAYLGVDGGGTKTAFRLIDEQGNTLATSIQPTSYYLGVGPHVLERVLNEGMREVTAAAGLRPDDIAYAFFGIPGYGEATADIPVIHRLARAALGHDRFTCGNDMLGGWAGSLGGEDGINVIAGTGSMAYGERDGVGHRVGGWSEVFGDEGSGYWIGRRGLEAFTHMSDGRTPQGELYDLVRQHFHLKVDLDLISAVLSAPGSQRTAIADLSKVVVRAAESGDAVAADILQEGADALVQLVTTTRRALGYTDEERALVSYSGGVFSAPRFRAAFLDGLASANEFEVIEPRHAPDLGSALYAMRCAGVAVPVWAAPHFG